MKSLSNILFPVAVSAAALAGSLGIGSSVMDESGRETAWEWYACADTVIYPSDGYKIGRKGNFGGFEIDDSLLTGYDFAEDTLPHILARDTIKVPDSLRFTDPFRYKYYIALVDSLTHVETRDSLRKSIKSLWSKKDTVSARLDSADLHKLDSIYFADSAVHAKAAFLAWYAGLSKDARKKYDYEQKVKIKMKQADSLKEVQEEKTAIRDSIRENTPRILETFALTDSMQYKRIIHWTQDASFHKMDVSIPDTSFNHYFYDMKFQREDVNATWLGVSGSPVQTYNYFKRKSESGTDFYTPNETWTFSARNIPNYNTKTPYTELAYWGTLLAKRDKEQDNIHIFTTQNIVPGWNFSLLYDRWGGGGMLQREETANKTFYFTTNYLGKKYAIRAGYIHNKAIRQENGGMVDAKWLRDTLVDSRDIPVNLQEANSELKQNSVFLEQQLRIPFNFIKNIKAKKDSSFKYDADTLDRNITTAFIGQSTEWSGLNRVYEDKIANESGQKFYSNADGIYIYNYGDGTASNDSLSLNKLDNKLFIKLQPWSSEGAVSKLNVGIGDLFKSYYLQSLSNPSEGEKVNENSVYVYAGVEGQVKKYFLWDAFGSYTFAGTNVNDLKVEGNARLNFYPFRKAKGSPLSILAHAETNLNTPDYYQRHIHVNHYDWDYDDLAKISTTKFEGRLLIPHWRLEASASYGLIGNSVYYDKYSVSRQHDGVVNVLSAYLRKEFVFAKNIVHLDNKILGQWSSNNEVIPLPMASLNLRYFAEFVVAKDIATKTHNVLVMQVGIDGYYNTKWYQPAFNPNIGVFYNQQEVLYNNGPRLDLFVNMQWKRACIFVKWENFNRGWPSKIDDSFTAHGYIYSPRSVKLGLFWPFYIQHNKNPKVN